MSDLEKEIKGLEPDVEEVEKPEEPEIEKITEPDKTGEAVIEPEEEETEEKVVEKVADPPEVKEETETFYQTKYQVEKAAHEEEVSKLTDKLERFTNYEIPEAKEEEPPTVEIPEEDEAYLTPAQIREITRQESLKIQIETQQAARLREYDREVASVSKLESDYVKKHNIPQDVLDAAKAEARELIPVDRVVGDASRRFKLVLKELAVNSIIAGKKALAETVKTEDADKTAQLEKISQPGGAGISPVVKQEKTANQKEAETIAPFDDEPD